MIARFTTIDPLADDYDWQTPYAYAANNPISNIDILGMAAASVQEMIDEAARNPGNTTTYYYDGFDEEGNYQEGSVTTKYTGRELTPEEKAKAKAEAEAKKAANKGGGATVYVENDGVGHVYLEVDGTVFSYGRYDGSYSPSSGQFGPVGNGVLLKRNHSYAVERMKTSPTTVYKFPKADAKAIYKYLDGVWQSGIPAKHGGMIVDTYILFGNNCSTVTCNALQAGGVRIPTIPTPKDFNEYMNAPAGSVTNSLLKYGPR